MGQYDTTVNCWRCDGSGRENCSCYFDDPPPKLVFDGNGEIVSPSSATSRNTKNSNSNNIAVVIILFLIFCTFVGVAQTNFGIVSTPGIFAFAAGGLLLCFLMWKIRKFLFWSGAIALGLYLVYYYFVQNKS
jgi:hypothetical protein